MADSTTDKGPPKTQSNSTSKLSTQVLLSRRGLANYFPYLEQAGYQFVENGSYMTDEEVDRILIHIERANNIRFTMDVRAELWKAFRHQWFQSHSHNISYLQRDDIPRLFLPKLGFREVESSIPFHQLDGDRQRQVTETKYKVKNPRGPGYTTEVRRFELYRRLTDEHYICRDLRRCVEEWQEKNPGTMLKEDPREEMLSNRIMAIMQSSNAKMLLRQTAKKRLSTMMVGLGVLSVFMFLMFVLNLYITYDVGLKAPEKLFWYVMSSSHQFRAATMYLIAFWATQVALGRWHGDIKMARLKRNLILLERLLGHLTEFRWESEKFRMLDMEAKAKEKAYALVEAEKTRRQAKLLSTLGKAKKKKKGYDAASSEAEANVMRAQEQADEMMRKWGGPHAFLESGELNVDLLIIKRSIEQSYSRLPALDDALRLQHNGSRRSGQKGSRVNPDERVIRVGPGSTQAMLALPEPELVILRDHEKERQKMARRNRANAKMAALPGGVGPAALPGLPDARPSSRQGTGSRSPGRITDAGTASRQLSRLEVGSTATGSSFMPSQRNLARNQSSGSLSASNGGGVRPTLRGSSSFSSQSRSRE